MTNTRELHRGTTTASSIRAIRFAASLAIAGFLTMASARAGEGETELQSIFVGGGYDKPVQVAAPPGDYDRVVVVERGGVIRLLLRGAPVAAPYLDIDARVVDPEFDFDERGLLGIAFHPQFEKNGELFVHYIDLNSDTVVSRFRVMADDPNRIDPDSEEIVFTLDQPWSNHNGGTIAFGPNDGYLYIFLGDGGGPAFDRDNLAQDPSTLIGKILRIDVDGTAPYEVPADNPFVGPGDPLDEIWAIGVRNIWRASFDSATGDLWFGDVGQFDVEEVNFQPAASPGGENYGWRCMEGDACTGFSGCTCNGPELTLPIATYGHDQGCAVTGGIVYRGCAIPDLLGTYFYADMCSARIFSMRVDEKGKPFDTRERTADLRPSGADWLVSFGEDAFGELYFCTYLDGNVYRIEPTTPGPTDCDVLRCRAGNVNSSGFIADVLRVNASIGEGTDRILDLGPTDSIRLTIDAPPSIPGGPAEYALYAYAKLPNPSTVTPLPAGLTASCRPIPWRSETRPPRLRKIWNNTGFAQLGKANRASTPAPSVVEFLPSGLGRPADVFFQGILRDPGHRNGRGGLTNAVSLRIR